MNNKILVKFIIMAVLSALLSSCWNPSSNVSGVNTKSVSWITEKQQKKVQYISSKSVDELVKLYVENGIQVFSGLDCNKYDEKWKTYCLEMQKNLKDRKFIPLKPVKQRTRIVKSWWNTTFSWAIKNLSKDKKYLINLQMQKWQEAVLNLDCKKYDPEWAQYCTSEKNRIRSKSKWD